MIYKIIGIIYLTSGYLLVLIFVLINPIDIFIDILVLFVSFLITMGFLIMFLQINKEIINNKKSKSE